MENRKIAEFPDVENKLQAPTKKSLFERQKAEAEAKRRKEAEETAAVYNDFVKSFDDDDSSSAPGGFGGGMAAGPRRHYVSGPGSIPTGPSRGGFSSRGGFEPKSGPGSLGPPPPTLSRKRGFDGFQQPPTRRDNDRGLLAFDDYDSGPTPPSKVFNTSDDEDEGRRGGRIAEPTVAKPTIRMASLPPGTSPAVIKALMPPNLTVDAVRMIPPPPGNSTEKRSMSAIVTLAKDTPGNDIDAAVNTLQNRYLGYGYYLNLHRHLSSAALTSDAAISGNTSTGNSMPFGAKPVELPNAGRGGSHPHAPNRFAPPTSYGPPAPNLGRTGPLYHVPVKPPRGLKELKLIHKTIESLLTHGPSFEALLMSRPSVQREEKWAWLWDSRSVGGVWYRWRLWEVLTNTSSKKDKAKYLPLFEGASAWKVPDRDLKFEYTTKLEEFVSDEEYNSSDEEDEDGEGGRRNLGGGPPPPTRARENEDEGVAYLNPLEKAKLTHLLARLPTSTGKLRKGDVARVTAFAISHSGRGADEVVAAILSNIEKPYAYTSANPDRKKEKEQSGDDAPAGETDESSDTSGASLIGLYVVSDILSSSSTSGVRHAWRYRSLFETQLKQRKIFEGLGRMEKRMNWGRLRAEKWKRSVGNLLGLWEGWCVFPQEAQEDFVNMFNNPPATKEEMLAKEKEDAVRQKEKSRWKAVEEKARVEEDRGFELRKVEAEENVDGEPMVEDDLDGVPMEDEDLDGVPMEEDDEDLDGEPMADDLDGEPMLEDQEWESLSAQPSEQEPKVTAKEAIDAAMTGQKRRRPRAEDMFADSDEE